MKRYCREIFAQLKQELQRCRSPQAVCEGQVVQCFAAAFQSFCKVNDRLKTHVFSSDAEEIEFFQSIRPKFTSQLEYYSLLYHSVLFEPADSRAAFYFWLREYRRLEKFESENGSFLRCFKNGEGVMAPYYFLRRHFCPSAPQAATIPGSTLQPLTNGDQLAAAYLALRRYRYYAAGRLKAI